MFRIRWLPLWTAFWLFGCGAVGTRANGDGGGADASPDGSPPPGRRVVFVTSVMQAGDLRGSEMTGVAGADATCQALASAAMLSGAFVAFLSSPQSPVLTRLTATGPWNLVSPDGGVGDTVFSDRASLAAAPEADVDVDEMGQNVNWTDFWSGNTESCSSWSSADATLNGTVGSATQSGGTGWQDIGVYACNDAHRLLCFQN